MTDGFDPTGDVPKKGGGVIRTVVVISIWLGIAFAAYYFLVGFGGDNDNNGADVTGNGADTGGGTNANHAGTTTGPASNGAANLPQTAIGIAYGTEKKHWLKYAAKEFEKTPAGKKIKVNLIPMGSVEGADAVVDGRKVDGKDIHVWTPASSMYLKVFEQKWQTRHSGNPIAVGKPLVYSPMVFVFWKDRYDAFVSKYNNVSFETINQAFREPGGWGGIAQEPEWGLFKFGHTHPNQSNSGLMTLVLLAYDYHDKSKGLTVGDITDPGYQKFMVDFEKAVSGLIHSTGTMMNDMVLKGPSMYDGVMVYESLAMEYFEAAAGHWGPLQVVYPKYNMWNDNPFYVLKAGTVDGVTKDHQRAAEIFLEFLLDKPMQTRAIEHGFRPADAKIPLKTPDSPFTKYAANGLTSDLKQICEPPPAQVIYNLQLTWERGVGK